MLPYRTFEFGRITLKYLLVILVAFQATLVQAAELAVRVSGAAAGDALVIQVYDSASAFGDFREPLRSVRVVAVPETTYTVDGVPPGDVAVVVYVDENNNGYLDKNFIGIPKEPLGISNGYRPKGPPVFDRARFAVAGDEPTVVDIGIYKVLGERGRLGIGAGVIGQGSPYAGSDTTVLQPIPAITYNGERLQWLGPNLQYSLAGSGAWRLAASASYRIGAYEEDDSPELAGLGDRDGTLMAGLGLRYEAPMGLNLVLRYEYDVLDKIGGGTASARVSKSYQAGWLRIAPQASINWLSAAVANYDFGVPASAATSTRPAYDTGSAVSYELGFGSFIELSESWRIIMNIGVEFLPDDIADSPIVDEDRVLKGFAAITYVF